MKIEELRKQIDRIDDNIITLLIARFELCNEIGKSKKENKSKIEDKDRENEILQKIADHEGEFDYKVATSKVFESIFNQSKNLQK